MYEWKEIRQVSESTESVNRDATRNIQYELKTIQATLQRLQRNIFDVQAFCNFP